MLSLAFVSDTCAPWRFMTRRIPLTALSKSHLCLEMSCRLLTVLCLTASLEICLLTAWMRSCRTAAHGDNARSS